MRHSHFAAVVLVALVSQFTFAQLAPEAGVPASPVAFVYVSSSPNGNNFELNAFAAASDGLLTPVSGSPFSENVGYLAANGTYLFADNNVDLFTYSIAADGAPTQVSSINAEQYGNNCGPDLLFPDRTGATRV